MILRKGKLIGLVLPWWDFEKHVVSIAAGRDVQAVKMQVGHFWQAIDESDSDLVARPDFKSRPWHRAIVAVERRATPSERDRSRLGRQGKVQHAALARHWTRR